MSRYLQRLAQRSGVTIGGADRSASANSSSATASLSYATPAADDRSGGFEIIDQVDAVSQPSPPQTRAASEVARLTVAQPNDSGLNKASTNADLAGRDARDHPANDVEPGATVASSQLIEPSESIDALGKRRKGPGSGIERSEDNSSPGQDRGLSDDRGRSFQSSSDIGAMTKATDVDEPLRSDAETETSRSSVKASTLARSAEPNAAVAPPNLIDQAIQWVMDDPHWNKQGDESIVATKDGRNLDPAGERSFTAQVAPRVSAHATSKEETGVGAKAATETPSRAESTSDVRVHIGRVSIEIRQPEGPTLVRQAPTGSNHPGTPSRSSSFSDSHLRRLYLRGF